MTKPHEIVFPRNYVDSKGDVKTQWMKLGVAFPSRDGKGWDCTMHAIPAPTVVSKDGVGRDGPQTINETGFRFMIREPFEEDQLQQRGGQQRGSFGGGKPQAGARPASKPVQSDADDDDIPRF